MNTLTIWILGQSVKEATRQAVKALFKDSDSLIKRLHATAEQWREKLPKGASLLAIEALFPEPAYWAMETPPPPPVQILAKLEKAELPNANDWSEALFQQWRWVRATIEEPQEFFLLPEDQARTRLSELGELLDRECQKDRELFQVESLRLQKEQKQATSELSESVQKISGLMAEVKSSLDPSMLAMTSFVEDKAAPTGDFHSEIDAAVAYTQRGSPDIALAQLEQLRKRHWDRLSSRERYRVLANMGHAYNAKDEGSLAARHFIDSRQYQPDDEQARCLESLGYLILGDHAHAFALATGIREIFQNSDMAHAIWVRSAPTDMLFDDVEAGVPHHLRSAVETAFALSWCALHADKLALAETYGRSALTHDDQSRMLLEQLGAILLESGRREASSQYTESPRLTAPEKMREAESLFAQALDKTPPTLPVARARIRHCLGRICQLLEKWDDSYEHLQAAFDSDKKNPQYACQFALALCDRKGKNRAIEILRDTIDSDDTRGTLILLARLLSARNGKGDCDEAIGLLSKQMAGLERLEYFTRSEIVATLTDLYCQTEHALKAAEILDNLPPGVLAPEAFHVIRAVRLRRAGYIEEAKREAKEAAQQITLETDHRERRRIVVELTVQGLFTDALPIWKALVAPRYLGLDTRTILRCAAECDDVHFIAEFCEALRKNGIVDREIVHLEIDTLLEYHCFNRAVEVMCGYLHLVPETTLMKEIRARLSHLATIIGRDDLVEHDPERLPSVGDVDPGFGLAIVEVLSHSPEPVNGVQYAYNLLRRHFDSHLAHKAMVVSMIFGHQRDLRIPEPDVAGPGAAVRYKEDDSDRHLWHIIEDSENPNQARNEYSPDHGISKVLIGKRQGEQFYLCRDNVQERTATIVDIWSKYKLRFNLCMEEWENRFPEERFLWKFSVKKDANDKVDFDPIFKSVDQRIAATRECEEIYRHYPLSVTSFAVMAGGSTLDAMQHLGSKPDLPIRCCSGTDEESALATEAPAKGVPVILDGSALASLFITRAYRHIQGLGMSLVVSEGTLLELRIRYLDKLSSPREGGFLTKNGDQHVLVEESPEAVQQRLGEYREFLDMIQSHSQAEEGMALCELSHETREKMIQFVGRPAAETIAIARSKEFILWTDDMCVAGLAAEHGSIPRVWTDAVARWGHAQGKIPSEVRNDLVLSLVRLGYFYTRVDTEIARWAGSRSGWSLADASFGTLIDWFSNPFTKREGITALAGQLLPEISRNASPFHANTVITTLLTKISQRPDGMRILERLFKTIDAICGVDVLTARNLKDMFRLWRTTS